ncbi:MAG TPA: hypothetical protein VK503_02770, partial [Candidatus Bathyarchaeia archaeon]|nr:hypothetical protein [Candidatus Bathyarchaeia archaeon]
RDTSIQRDTEPLAKALPPSQGAKHSPRLDFRLHIKHPVGRPVYRMGSWFDACSLALRRCL